MQGALPQAILDLLSNTEVTIILFLLLKAGQSFYSSSSGTFEYPVRVTEDGRCG